MRLAFFGSGYALLRVLEGLFFSMRLAFFGSGYALLRVLEGLFFSVRLAFFGGLIFLTPRDFTTRDWVSFFFIYIHGEKLPPRSICIALIITPVISESIKISVPFFLSHPVVF